MAKDIIYDTKAKEKLLAGIEKLEKTVATTLGPAGKNVIIDEYGSIHSTKDGVTTAKAVVLSDPFENLGANAMKEVAEKSNKNCGDGTTTSTILASAIFRNGLKYVSLGSNATQVKNGIVKAAKKAVELVKASAKPISTREDIRNVAKISANGDTDIADKISDVMDKLGKDGTIKVEDSQTMEMTSKIVEGMVLDVGYVSPYMVTSPDTMEADLDSPFVMLVNKKVSNMQDVLKCMQSVSQTGRPLVIIADDFAEDVTASVIVNKMRGTINAVLVKSPSYGDNRKAIMDDIAVTCGGMVISDETALRFENATIESGIIGQAKRVIVKKDSTIIFDGMGDKNAVSRRADAIRSQIENSSSEYEKEKLHERLSKLVSGIGIISVGADTEAERKELRDRVDDAFCAAKAAIRMGIVPGGGTALLNVKKALTDEAIGDLVGDEVVGVKIFRDSLEAPIRRILENAGIDPSMIVAKILEGSDIANYGYNVISKKFVDMVEDGVIDPAEVVVNEIQNASSVSGLLLTTDALVVEAKDDKKSCGCGQPAMPPMM